MIKGVNKQIIEIKCPKDERFEKILLFVNSEKYPAEREITDEKAKLIAKTIFDDPRFKKAKLPGQSLRGHGVAAGVCAAFVGVVVLAAVLLL